MISIKPRNFNLLKPSTADPPLALPQAAWLCFVCGADFRHWVDLPHEVRMAFLMKHREFKIERLLIDRCPRCDAPLTATAQVPESATTLHVH